MTNSERNIGHVGDRARRNLLVIDVGTTGLRAAIVDDRLQLRAMEYRAFAPTTPAPGLVEFDAAEMARLVLDAAHTVLGKVDGPIVAVGITNQRASTIVWDRATGQPVGPGIGWQDLRTIGECIMAKAEHGWALAPNQSVTKLAWILANTVDEGGTGLAGRDLCFGTVDSWVAWTLSGGSAGGSSPRAALHVSDQTNASAATSALRLVDGSDWNDAVLDAFSIPRSILPDVVDSVGVCGLASALPGAPPIAGMLGDQQASLVGQSCVVAGRAKVTFGTGGMLDLCTDAGTPVAADRTAAGTFPLPLWSSDGVLTWGVEGIMLSAGTNIEWLRDDLGIIGTSAESHDVAQGCATSDGVVYVPALLGLGTPHWDYGARGTLLGITRGTERSHVVRAVLEGIAHRGADLIDAAMTDTGVDITVVRIDGGMSENPTFVQAFADAAGRPIEVSPIAESTTIGAAFMAGLGVGVFGGMDDLDSLWRPSRVVEPTPGFDHAGSRERWLDAVSRSAGWIPELSSLDF
jgi:glycerol kinase